MKTIPYQGVEQGPIRPPSEAKSLFLRVTRNCPWNRCTFCPLYKQTTFSIRPLADVKSDIDTLARHVESLHGLERSLGYLSQEAVQSLRSHFAGIDQVGFEAALHWFLAGMESVFLQDANSLVVKPKQLSAVLNYLKERFPQIRRITSYARSQTIAKMKDEELRMLREAGLNRLHIGLESGSDEVLRRVAKGATQAIHINAGRKVIEAGMELSEYYMPGLGGQDYGQEHALASAHALNQINPHFIRLRTLAIPPHTPLWTEYSEGRFHKPTDLMIVEEIRLFLQNLDGIRSWVASDHILNLLPELQGVLPTDKAKMLRILDDFVASDPKEQRLYQIGRRCGWLSRPGDLADPVTANQVRQLYHALGVTADNVDGISDALMQRFI